MAIPTYWSPQSPHHMLLLVIGFIVPAVLFALIGFLACFRRSTNPTDQRRKDSYQSISEAPHGAKRDLDWLDPGSVVSYQTVYQNRHFLSSDPPPSYSEAVGLPNIVRPEVSSSGMGTDSRRHLPPNQPKIRPPSLTSPPGTSASSSSAFAPPLPSKT